MHTYSKCIYTKLIFFGIFALNISTPESWQNHSLKPKQLRERTQIDAHSNHLMYSIK